MAKDVYYFKHDTNANADLKIKAMRKRYGWEGYGWYWYLVELLRSEDGYEIDYGDTTWEALAADFGCDLDRAKKFVDDCITFKLLGKNGEKFYSDRLKRDMKRLEEVRDQRSRAGKISAKKRLEPLEDDGLKLDEQQMPNTCSTGVQLLEQSRGEERGGNKSIYNKLASSADDLQFKIIRRTFIDTFPALLLPEEALRKLLEEYGVVPLTDAIVWSGKHNAKRPVSYIRQTLEAWKVEGAPDSYEIHHGRDSPGK